MTRDEEILKQVIKEKSPELQAGFISGANWADANPNLYNDEKYHTVKVSCLDELNRKAKLYDVFLEKACEWLKTLTYQEFAGAPLERLITDELISEFRQAMKGE
jgi:hypothetical protein